MNKATLLAMDPGPAWKSSFKAEGVFNMRARTVILIPILLIVVASHTGCFGRMMRTEVMSDRPTFPEVESNWPAISSSMGRVVVCFPSAAMMQVAKPGGLGLVNTMVRIDALAPKVDTTLREGWIFDGSFFFVDLTPGRHEIASKAGGFFTKSKIAIIDISAGEVTYVKLLAGEKPRVVTEQEARTILPQLRNASNHLKPVSLTTGDPMDAEK